MKTLEEQLAEADRAYDELIGKIKLAPLKKKSNCTCGANAIYGSDNKCHSNWCDSLKVSKQKWEYYTKVDRTERFVSLKNKYVYRYTKGWYYYNRGYDECYGPFETETEALQAHIIYYNLSI